MATQDTAGQNQPLNEEGPRSNLSEAKNRLNKLKEKVLPGARISLILPWICNFAMLIIGCLAVHKCPVEQNIPLFLIATGGIGVFSKFVTYVRTRITENSQLKFLESSLYSVETVFFLLGSYWVYKEYKPSYDPADGNAYCQKTAYMVAFIYITIFYALFIAIFGGLIMFLICICCVACCQANDEGEVRIQISANDQNTGNPV